MTRSSDVSRLGGPRRAMPTFVMNVPTSTEPGGIGRTRIARLRQAALPFLRAFSREPKRAAPRRLLFLDDDPRRAETFLSENPEAVWVKTVAECLDRMTEPWDEVHLDHDLGGQHFVDVNQVDCGMEVIRWLCKEPRPHLNGTLFFVHTHNSVAGLLMVLQMRTSGYNAEFRPFGLDLAKLLAHNEPGPDPEAEVPAPAAPRHRRLFAWLYSLRSRFGMKGANGPVARDSQPRRPASNSSRTRRGR